MPHYPRKWSLKSRRLLARSNEIGGIQCHRIVTCERLTCDEFLPY